MGGERRREVGGGRKEIMQKMARATARPPKFVAAMGHLVKGTRGVLCPIIYRANPLSRAAAVTENDGDDAVDDEQDDENEDVASRWARDARRLCDWQNIHPSLDVAHALGGAVPEERGHRKRQQILNVVLFVAPLLVRKPDAVVVDFCCGGAHQSLPLAPHFPHATFIMLDAKQRSLAREHVHSITPTELL